eukprot:XP_011682698.1 PREDICTED: protein phosphatase 1 regulatory subunit 21-like [Strongylocentrotus purpuratus]
MKTGCKKCATDGDQDGRSPSDSSFKWLTDSVVAVTILGTPDSEGNGKKMEAIKEGFFKDVDLAVTFIPFTCHVAKPIMLTIMRQTICFKGKAAHASTSPWDGRNALDAAILCYNNISVLRQQLKPYMQIHYLSKNYNFKVSLEHQLPIASQKLKTTDECVVSSLISLVTCTGKISNFMKANLDFFTRPVGYGNSMGSSVGGQSTSPCVPLLRQRAVAFMAALTKPCPETVPYSTAVQNQRILLSSTESKEGLAQQVASSSSRIARLEQEKEHWVLEAQLMQIKYDREMQQKEENSEKSAELESVLKGQGGVTIKQSPSQDKIPPSTPASKHDDIAQDTSMLGTADKLAMDFGGSDETSRENMIKSHYTSRLLELRTHQQICDSKGVNFSAECRALRKRLTLADKSKDRQVEELKNAQHTIHQMKDELQTTTKNYESQLSMMSEHLCSMNEKLTSQKDEIDALKLSMKQQHGKKGRGK